MGANKLPDPPWIVEAKKHIGLHEQSSNYHPLIEQWKKELGGAWLGNVPWCGVMVAHCVHSAGLDVPAGWYRAKDWLKHGKPLKAPAVGCVVVFLREGGGHVAFVLGVDKYNNLVCIGGNQQDSVKISAFSRTRVAGYRWPSTAPMSDRYNLPVLNTDGTLSENEA